MDTRFKSTRKILDIVITAVAAMLSVGTTIYGVFYFGINDHYAQLAVIVNIFYLACLVMIWMYFFNVYLTTHQFNYWCSLCLGITVLLRDILFPSYLSNYIVQLSVLTLSVLLLCMLTYFYARKEWKTYTKGNLWTILLVDVLIATLYHLEIYLEPNNEYTEFFLTEIWTRPTITYGLVACYIISGEEGE